MLTNNATTWRLQAHLHFLNCACWTIKFCFLAHAFHQWPSLDTDSYWAAMLDELQENMAEFWGSWAWHRKQHVWIMNELNMPNVQFIKIISHDSVWFFSVRFHLEGGKWHLCDLPSKYWGKRHSLRWKTAAFLVSSCQFMKKKEKKEGMMVKQTIIPKTIFPDSKQNYKSNLE